MAHESSFPELFRVYEAIQVIVSTAFHDGVPIWADYAVPALAASFPTCGLSETELRDAVLEAALRAGVSVSTVSAVTLSRHYQTERQNRAA